MAARAIAVPLSPPFPAPEIQYILDQSGASILVSSPTHTPKANEVLATDLKQKPSHLELPKHMGSGPKETVEFEDIDPAGAGLMLYTSGTTNRPVSFNNAHHLPDI
jgi:acyl-CoA synthetase (AMP-forming)/AMP-acid ligase II